MQDNVLLYWAARKCSAFIRYNVHKVDTMERDIIKIIEMDIVVNSICTSISIQSS
jgi:hypothetical protein